jgi:hypothetical protein
MWQRTMRHSNEIMSCIFGANVTWQLFDIEPLVIRRGSCLDISTGKTPGNCA